MGETDCGRNWVLFWWAGPCSVTLKFNFLLKGGAVFPPCYLTWGQTLVKVMKIMMISFKMSHTCTATLSAPNLAVGHCWPLPLPETPWHSWASLGQSLVGSLEWRLRGAGVTLRRSPTLKGKGEAPSKMVGGANSPLESNPIPTRDA